MDKLRIQQLHKRDEMLCAIDIRFERFVHRGIEVHDAREVHNNVDLSLQFLDSVRVDSAERFVKIAFQYRDLPSHGFNAAEALHGWFHGWGSENVRKEPLFPR